MGRAGTRDLIRGFLPRRSEQAEGVLLFLGVVEPHDRVQAVEAGTEVGEFVGFGFLADVVEAASEAVYLVLDLGVGAAEGACRVGPAKGAGDDGQELLLLGSFVRQQVEFEPVEQFALPLQVGSGV